MAHLDLYFLGSPRIERDGVTAFVDTRKAIALLAYLVMTGQPHSRDTLAALLWPDYDQSHARAALRRTLSALNKALDGDWLAIEREAIGARHNTPMRADALEFQQHLTECRRHHPTATTLCAACLTHLQDALRLYQGDFLAGFSLRDSAGFDDWQFFEAEHLRRELAFVLEHLTTNAVTQGDFAAAITCAQRWLQLDRLHEMTHQTLMRLYAWSGQRAAALRQYRECARALDQELGVPPLEATTRLYEAIKDHHLEPPPAPASVKGEQTGSPALAAMKNSAPVATTAYPLLGRAEEWASMLATYAAITDGGHLTIIEGEAGIGKTRLAEEFIAYARARGAPVMQAHCYEGEAHLAYAPFAAALRDAVMQPASLPKLQALPASWLSELARLTPDLPPSLTAGPLAVPLDGPGARSRFYEGVCQGLYSLTSTPTAREAGVIFIDDVHWADHASLDLLLYLVRRLQGHRIYLLVTWRSSDVVTNYPLHQLAAETQRMGSSTHLTLGRLDASTVARLADAALPHDRSSPSLAHHLYAETEGVPFFVMEYLTALAQGQLHADHAAWSLPGGVRDLLRSRLHAVSEVGWQILHAAAVIGRSFEFDLLRLASGRSEEEAVTALEELSAQGIIVEMHAGSEQQLHYDFGHEKLRAVVNDEMSLARRRLLHRRITDAIIAQARGQRDSGPLASAIAQHAMMAGDPETAATYFRIAGDYAASLYANAEALTHFRAALGLGAVDATAIHEAIGDVQTLMGEYGNALQSYVTAATLRDAAALARIEHKLGNVYARCGDWSQAQAHLEAALAMVDQSAAGAQARILADLGFVVYHRGQIEPAQDLIAQALTLAASVADTPAQAQAHNIAGVVASRQGDLGAALQHLEQSLALAEQLGEPGARIAALNNLALAQAAHGDPQRGTELIQVALALCVAQGDRHREAALHNNLADLLHAQGLAAAALAHIKQAVTIYAEIGVVAGAMQPEIWKLTEW